MKLFETILDTFIWFWLMGIATWMLLNSFHVVAMKPSQNLFDDAIIFVLIICAGVCVKRER